MRISIAFNPLFTSILPAFSPLGFALRATKSGIIATKMLVKYDFQVIIILLKTPLSAFQQKRRTHLRLTFVDSRKEFLCMSKKKCIFAASKPIKRAHDNHI